MKNRLHAAEGSGGNAALRARSPVRREGVAAIARDAGLERKFDHLKAIKGIGEVSAIQLPGELAGLDPTMTVRQ